MHMPRHREKRKRFQFHGRPISPLMWGFHPHRGKLFFFFMFLTLSIWRRVFFFFQVSYALCHYNSPPTNFVCVCEVVCRHLTLIEKSTPPSPLTLYTHTHTLNVSKDNFLFFRKMHITKVWSFISSLGNYSCALCLNCRVILSTEKMFHEKATQFIFEKKKRGGGIGFFVPLSGINTEQWPFSPLISSESLNKRLRLIGIHLLCLRFFSPTTLKFVFISFFSFECDAYNLLSQIFDTHNWRST